MFGRVGIHLPETTGGGNNQRTQCLETRLSFSSSQHPGERKRGKEEEEKERHHSSQSDNIKDEGRGTTIVTGCTEPPPDILNLKF